MLLALFRACLSRVVLSVLAVAAVAFPAAGSAQTIFSADLSIVLTGPTSVSSTQKLVQYTVVMKNAGPSLSSRPTFTATFPSTISSIVALPGNQRSQCIKNPQNSTNFSCYFIGTPPVNKDQRFIVTVDVSTLMSRICSSSNPQAPQIATAKVAKPAGRVIDPNLSNNVSESRFTASCPSRQAGNLFVMPVTPALPPMQIVGGTLGDSVLGLEISADTEPVNVTTIRFSLPPSSLRSLDRVELYKLGESNPFAAAMAAMCGSDAVPAGTVCAQIPSRLLVVQKGTTITLLARPRLRSDVLGALSGDSMTLSLQSLDARGEVTNVALVQNDGDATLEGEVMLGRKDAGPDSPLKSAAHVTVLSKLASITNASPDADGSGVPTGSARSIGQFLFTALPNNNTKDGLNRFTLDRAIFTVDLTNVAIDSSSFIFFNKADPTMKSSCTVDASSTATKLYVDCAALASSSVVTEIDQGSSATFVLGVTVTNPQVVKSVESSLQVTIEQYNDAAMTSVSPSMSHLRWLDRDAGANTPFFWIESTTNLVRSTRYGNPVGILRMLGDVNNDGKLSSADTTLMRRHFEGTITLTGADFTAGDVDQDGFINVSDFYLERGAIGQLITLPAVYGDVTGDGKVTSEDRALVEEFVSGVKTPSTRQKYLGDVNVDNVLNHKDVDFISQAILKIVVLPVLCGNGIVNIDAREQCDDGNTTIGDGCDLMCKIDAAWENELTIVQKSLASTNVAVPNQKSITLLRFGALADNEGILAKKFVFDAAQGSLENVTSYSLVIDANDDGVVDTVIQSGVIPHQGVVSFDALEGGGYSLPSKKEVVFEVRADVVQTLVSSSLQLKFATTIPSYIAADRLLIGNSLSGIKTDGVCATQCEITVKTVASTLWNFRSQGDLYLTASATPMIARQLLGGTLSDALLLLNARAEAEDVEVTHLVFTAQGADASSFTRNISRLELYRPNEVAPFSVATAAACGSSTVPAYSMCAVLQNKELVVTQTATSDILVRARVKTDVDGAVSGQHLLLSVDALLGAQARGAISASNLAPNDGDATPEGELFIGTSTAAPSQTILGKESVVVLSKIASITNVDPNPSGSMLPTGSDRPIGQFRFVASANANTQNGVNKVLLDHVTFTVNITNVSIKTSSFKVSSKADPFMSASCTLDPSSTSTVLLVHCPNLASSAFAEIDAGSDITLVLTATIEGSQPNASLQVSLQNFNDSTKTVVGPAASHIRWIDSELSSIKPFFFWFEYPESRIDGIRYQN